jgi:ATP-dependent Clp protease ATP-binding subunit ClpC
LIQEGEGVAAKALASLGVEFQATQERVVEVSSSATESAASMGTGEATDLPAPSPRAKRVLDLSRSEAVRLGNGYVGTEHMLLGLIQEGEGIGVQVLQSFGIELSRVRRQVMGVLGGVEVNAGEGGNRFPHRVGEPKCTGCGADLTMAARYRTMTIPPTIPYLPSIAVEAVFCDQCGILAGILKAD